MNMPYTYPSGDKVFTIPEVAAYLKISKSKIYYLVSQKQIPHLKVGRNVRIRESDLQKWLELQTEKVSTPFKISPQKHKPRLPKAGMQSRRKATRVPIVADQLIGIY